MNDRNLWCDDLARRQRQPGNRAGRLARRHAAAGANAPGAARGGAPSDRRAGGQESRTGPQGSPGRPGADGRARGPRSAQQPGAGHALPEPAAAADRRRTRRAWPCWTRSSWASPRWTPRSTTCCNSPPTAIRSCRPFCCGGLVDEIFVSLAPQLAAQAIEPLQRTCPSGSKSPPTATCSAAPC